MPCPGCTGGKREKQGPYCPVVPQVMISLGSQPSLDFAETFYACVLCIGFFSCAYRAWDGAALSWWNHKPPPQFLK